MASFVSPSPATPDLASLEKQLDRTVKDWCGKYGTVGDGINHCAHFVSHLLQLRIPGAALCSNVGGSKYTYEERRAGYCVRVNQIFNSCSNTSRWDDKDLPKEACFIVATIESNIEKQDPKKKNEPVKIGDNSRKHIGIYLGGTIFHYSNKKDKVIKQSVAEFSNHYGKSTVLLRASLPK